MCCCGGDDCFTIAKVTAQVSSGKSSNWLQLLFMGCMGEIVVSRF